MKTLRPVFEVEYRDGRITKDDWLLLLAWTVSLRATCPRRAVGCVLADEGGHVLATGYNGSVRGTPHCLVNPCAGAPPGDVSCCQAVHAEQNALLQLFDVHSLYTAYLTCSPCVTCVNLLLNAGCQRIIYAAEHRYSIDAAMKAWTRHRHRNTWIWRKGMLPVEYDPGDPRAFGG